MHVNFNNIELPWSVDSENKANIRKTIITVPSRCGDESRNWEKKGGYIAIKSV